MEKNIIIKTIIISSIIILIMVLILSSLFIYKKQNTNKVQTYKYNEKARKAIKELNISDILNDLDYSRTIEVMLENKTYQEKYLSEYQKIEYQEINNFSNIINTLLDKNYQSEEINYLIKHYLKDLNIILNMDYINILEFKDIKNVHIVKDSAENVIEILKSLGFDHADYIVSGLPFTSLPKNVSLKIFNETKKIINKGYFITFQYSKVKRHFFEKYFDFQDILRVLKNLPPAYVFVLKNKK